MSGKTAAKLPKDAEAENEIADFIRDRVKQQLQVEKYDYDVLMQSLHLASKIQFKF